MEFEAAMTRAKADAAAWVDQFGKDYGFPVDTVLFACPYDEDKQEVIGLAQEYIAEKGLSADDVKIKAIDGLILVIAKKVVFKPTKGENHA